MERRLLNVAQVAEMLGVSQPTIRRWCRTGVLPCIRFHGRRGTRHTTVRFDSQVIAKFIDKAASAAEDEVPPEKPAHQKAGRKKEKTQ